MSQFDPDIVEQAAQRLHITPYMICMEAAKRDNQKDHGHFGGLIYTSWISGALPDLLKTFCQQVMQEAS